MKNIVFCAIVFCSAAFSQEFRGTISGRVVDQQDAVVPNANVHITEVATGSKRSTTADADGIFTVPFLSPGQYEVAAEAPGFKRFVRQGIQVSTNARISLDIRLEIGQVNESVLVSADAPMLQTVTASTGQVIDSRQIDNMPMNGRTPLSLAQLAFGVVPATDPRFTRPFDNAGPAGLSMGGAPAQTNELLFDGAPDNTKDNRVAYNPPVDAVAEVKVESFQADAAYGHTAGGTVNVVMKSGTNALHGSAYDFNQLSNLAATPFFNNRSGQKKAGARYNQYGITGGGPVWIPKIVDGRNKVFFFFAFEGIDNMASKPTFATVPTAAERTGDFSALLKVGTNYQIYDPFSGVQAGARIQRLPYANNMIPSNKLDPIAKAYIQNFYPLPNVAGTVDGQSNFYNGRNGELNTFDNELSRFDFNLNEKHKLFWSFRHNVRYGSGASDLGQAISSVPSAGGSIRVNWGTMMDDVYTFAPTVLLNTRLAWTRYSQYTTNYSGGFDMTSLGFPASLKAVSRQAVLPQISFSNFTGAGASAGGPNPEDTFQIFSTLNKTTGRHSLKMGVDLRQFRNSQINYASASGSYTFSTNWTKGPLDNSSAAPLGQDFASFLIGLPTSGAFDVNSARTNSSGYYALFVQDDFRVKPNLTLNLGLRYEFETPTTERYDRTTNGFDQTTPNPLTAAALAAYAKSPIAEIPVGQFKVPGGLLYAGPGNRELYSTPKKSFSPRIGAAWTPAALGGKTVLRGGTGLFYSPYGVTAYNQTGFNQRTDLVPTLDSFLTPAATLSNPFPGGILQPIGSSQGLLTFTGRNVAFFNANPQAPYSFRWNFDVQQQLGRNLVLEAGYMGNHAVHLTIDRQINYVPRQYLSTSQFRDQAAIDRLTANVANPFSGLVPGTNLNGTTVARSQLLVPFPQFTQGVFNSSSSGVIDQSTNAGSSYFHQLQVRLDKRLAHGLQFTANYSYSKLMQKLSYLNLSDLLPEKRIAGEDRPQRLVVSASYDIPVGRGRKFGARMHPVLNHAVGGWRLNMIFITQSGAPLNWTGANPIYLGGDLHMDGHNVDRTFDKSVFDTNSKTQLDQSAQIRYFPTAFANLRSDKASNWDLSVIKDFGILERLKVQLRGEFFNAFNHPEFSGATLTPTSSTFGTITGQANSPRAIQLALRLVW